MEDKQEKLTPKQERAIVFLIECGNVRDAAQKFDRSTVARFKHLIERARFELKLANDMAEAYGFGVKVQSPLNSARRELIRCLDEFEKVNVNNLFTSYNLKCQPLSACFVHPDDKG